jgi:peptide/nickel transport system substrate-binding protein
MKKRFLAAVLLSAFAASSAMAVTFKWASRGDAQTMDPFAQNELLTNAMNAQVYEKLVMRDKKLNIVPSLAESWQQLSPTHWRFKVRKGVKFSDGSPLTIEDIVFSHERAKDANSQIKLYANDMGKAVKVDENTVDFIQDKPNVIFLQQAEVIFIMSKAWCEKNKVTRVQSFKDKEETYAARNAMGTGPWMLKTREFDVKTVHVRNPNYWGKVETNVDEVVYTPIKSDPTRVAALISGEIDFMLDPPPQDTDRLAANPNTKVINGAENRIIFIGMDQARDELLYSSVKGKNPLKDVRVRKALYHAIDIEAIKTKIMRNQAYPTGAIMPSPLGTYNDPTLEGRLPYDVAKGKALMTEAGYPNGFEITLDCPNDRYINDANICVALGAMWERIGVKTKVQAQPKATYFAKAEKLDVSMYMLGWGGSITDADTSLKPIYHSRTTDGKGTYNWGNLKNPAMDDLIMKQTSETDPVKREALIKAAIKMHNDNVHHLPLHRQVIPWASRKNVEVVHRADNWLEYQWVMVK